MNAGSERTFVDSNVLLYSVDDASSAKKAIARKALAWLWAESTGRVSWQVLNEFQANASKKLFASTQSVRDVVNSYAQWDPVAPSLPLVYRAWHWIDHAQVSYWDALIVAAAEQAGCTVLLSEDF